MPDFYRYMVAAPRLGISVPELVYRVDVLGEETWLDWAFVTQAAEQGAEHERERRRQIRAKLKRR
jgi:hypothetical protein